jgi:hypothetical protein
VPIFTGTNLLEGTNVTGGGKALAVKTITPDGSYGGNIDVEETPPPPPKKTGGGGSKGSKAKQTKRSDVVDRYKEITD